MLRVDRVDQPSVLRRSGGAEQPQQKTAPPPIIFSPRAHRPSPRGMLSPGPRGRIALGDGTSAAGDNHRALSPSLTPDVQAWSEQGVNKPPTPSPSNGSVSSVKAYTAARGGGWAEPARRSNSAGGTSGTPFFPAFNEPTAPGGVGIAPAALTPRSRRLSVPTRRTDDLSPPPPLLRARVSFDAATNGVTAAGGDAAPSGERTPGVLEHPRGLRRPRLSMPQRHTTGGIDKATSMLQPKASGWDALPSPPGRQEFGRMGAPSGHISPPSALPAPLAAPGGASPGPPRGYGPPPILHQHWSPHSSQPLRQRHSPEALVGDKPRPHRGPQVSVGMGLGPMPLGPPPPPPLHAWGHGAVMGATGGPTDQVGVPPQSPPNAIRSTSDPPPPFPGVNDPKEYYASRTTVAEERLRRRRLEGWEQQQQQQQWQYQYGAVADWGPGYVASATDAPAVVGGEGGLAGAGTDDASPGCCRASSGTASAWSTSSRRYSPTSIDGRGRTSSLGLGRPLFVAKGLSLSPTSSATSGGVGSPFRRVDRRSRTPPPGGWGYGEDGSVGRGARPASCSQSPPRGGMTGSGKISPPRSDLRNVGRSESVPPRPRSWTGPRSAAALSAAVAAAAESDVASEGKSSPDTERHTLGILLPLDYSG